MNPFSSFLISTHVNLCHVPLHPLYFIIPSNYNSSNLPIFSPLLPLPFPISCSTLETTSGLQVSIKSHFPSERRPNLNRSTEICCEMYNAPQEMTSSLRATLERDRKRWTARRWRGTEGARGTEGVRHHEGERPGEEQKRGRGARRMKQTEINRGGDTCTHVYCARRVCWRSGGGEGEKMRDAS